MKLRDIVSEDEIEKLEGMNVKRVILMINYSIEQRP